VRKAIANAKENFWTKGQMAEMAVDAVFQKRRIAIGGIGELRGNGQFVRREALECCGGWNEETITDDLDLTIRLHLDRWDVDFMTVPTVEEEGVTRAIALWHQRNRWAEGGYQRYLDYWRPILQNRMGSRKTLDLLMFWVIQYLLPTAMIPDALMAIIRNRPLLLTPVTGLTLPMFILGTVAGLRQIQRSRLKSHNQVDGNNPNDASEPSLLGTFIQALYGSLYMFHWLPVIASMTARISVRPKRLKWVKTIHKGEA